jgi:hypothetical protein
MGDVLHPRPPQWRLKQEQVDVKEDRVIALYTELRKVLTENIDNGAVQLAALRLVQKSITMIISEGYGKETARVTLAQASELAAQYEPVKGEPKSDA